MSLRFGPHCFHHSVAGILAKCIGVRRLDAMRPARHSAVWLLLAALLVHAGVITVVTWRTGGVDGYAFKSLDSREYYALAAHLTDYGSFRHGGEGAKPETWRTPGYPLFLAACMLLFGKAPAALVLAQQFLSVANVLLLFRVGRRWLGRRRALLVALLFLLEPYHLFYSTWLLGTTWFVTVLLLTWVAWDEAISRFRWEWCAVAGVLAGFAVLVRPVAGFVPMVLLAGLVLLLLRERGRVVPSSWRRRAVACVSAFAVGAALVVGSWMTRNAVVAGHFALSDQSGVVLAYFKATEVALWRDGREGERFLETSLDPARADQPHSVWESIDARLRERLPDVDDSARAELSWTRLAQGNRTEADSFEVSNALFRIGWEMLTEAPFATLGCYGVRCAAILAFPLNLAISPPKGLTPNRIRSAALGVCYTLLTVLVLVRLPRGRLSLAVCWFPLVCTLALLAATTPQIDPRFRVPMIPMLLVLACLPRSSSEHTR